MVTINAVVESENIYILYNSSHILLENIMNYNVKKHSNFLKQDKRRLHKLKKMDLKKIQYLMFLKKSNERPQIKWNSSC